VLDQAHHRGPAFRIGDSCHVSLGFVNQEIDVFLSAMKQLAVHFDVIECKIGLGAEFSDDLSVDGDPALGNQFFSFATRGNSGGGDDFL
jgi:hypothetical protein